MSAHRIQRIESLGSSPDLTELIRFISISSQIILCDTEPTGGFIPACETLCFYLNLAHFCRKSIMHCIKSYLFPRVLFFVSRRSK